MMIPNLASRPFLNTRPVWLVTAAAVAVTLVLSAINIRLFMASNEALATQLERRDELVERHQTLDTDVRRDVAALQRVRWRRLSYRVEGLNVILLEHGFSWLTMLDDIEQVMPWAIRLMRIGPSISTDQVSLAMEGVAQNRDAMLDFIDNLFADPRFGDPRIHYEELPDANKRTVGYMFSISVDYLPERQGP